MLVQWLHWNSLVRGFTYPKYKSPAIQLKCSQIFLLCSSVLIYVLMYLVIETATIMIGASEKKAIHANLVAKKI